ncbi:MAG: phosphatase PAP2 family protein [Bacteroidales bacterium]|nr:phosphatase PAP2 family protein [Bacteroidales bacterium]
MEQLLQFDTRLFRLVNGNNASWLDWPMWVLSQHASWAVVLVAVFLLVILRYDRRRWWLPVIAVILCFLFADQISVHLFKDLFARPRPCHVLSDVNMFRTGCGGQYGFVSSHAANAFAIAVFLILRYTKRLKRSWVLSAVILVWAMLICYSRVYLGKHYPGDVVCGALVGAVIGWLVWTVSENIECRIEKKIAQK